MYHRMGHWVGDKAWGLQVNWPGPSSGVGVLRCCRDAMELKGRESRAAQPECFRPSQSGLSPGDQSQVGEHSRG
jgi:hypothetical protein